MSNDGSAVPARFVHDAFASSMNVLILTPKKSQYAEQFAAVVEEINKSQRFFELELSGVNWLPNDAESKHGENPEKLRKVIAKRLPRRCVVAITESWFEPDLLCHEYRGVSLVTVNEWESRFAPPQLQTYLLHQIASALINFSANLCDDQIEDWAHSPPIGCLFDWYTSVRQLRRAMIAAHLCGACEVRLVAHGMPDQALKAIETLMRSVRSAVIRRPRTAPSTVFIGHGHSKTWEIVSEFVVGLGLPVREFNSQSAIGVTNIERLSSMLDDAALALVVMTGDDRWGKSARARQNVIHEIGLFQGRIGFERTAVLREPGVEGFSNFDGLGYIEIEKGRLGAKAERDLRAVLVRERLLTANEGKVARRSLPPVKANTPL